MCVVKEINLEGNRANISSNPIPLLSVEKLNLSNTGLDRINLSGLTKLTTLSLEDNSILENHMYITCLSHVCHVCILNLL